MNFILKIQADTNLKCYIDTANPICTLPYKNWMGTIQAHEACIT